jgi:hypothetical protein
LAIQAARLDTIWEGIEPDWIAVDVPKAVKDRLIKFRPYKVPKKDPFEKEEQIIPVADLRIKERLLFQFLRDAPFLPNGYLLSEATPKNSK